MTQAFNLSQIANKVNSSGQLDLTSGVTGVLPFENGGTGLSTIGTNGQILYSNGSILYWGNAPTSGVTSLNGQTGAITNTDLYAIGSYVTGRPANTTTYNLNDTVAGSSLYSSNFNTWYVPANPDWRMSYSTSIQVVTPTLVNTGTWRCLTSTGGVVGVAYPLGLWVRIS